jgi:hypothetical protein
MIVTNATHERRPQPRPPRRPKPTLGKLALASVVAQLVAVPLAAWRAPALLPLLAVVAAPVWYLINRVWRSL